MGEGNRLDTEALELEEGGLFHDVDWEGSPHWPLRSIASQPTLTSATKFPYHNNHV